MQQNNAVMPLSSPPLSPNQSPNQIISISNQKSNVVVAPPSPTLSENGAARSMLAVFDFDFTLIDVDSDEFAMTNVLGPSAVHKFSEAYRQGGNWANLVSKGTYRVPSSRLREIDSVSPSSGTNTA
jgi:hypothetical protein